MVSFFKNFNKLDLAAFEADTEITESFGVIYWLCLCLLNKSGSRGCVLQRLYSQLQTQSTIFSRLKAQEPRSKRWQGCGAKGNLMHCWWECKLVQLLWKTVWRFFKILKIEQPYDPAILILGIYPKELKPGSQRDVSTPMFTAALFTLAKIWKQPKCPLKDKWIKKMWYIQTLEYY